VNLVVLFHVFSIIDGNIFLPFDHVSHFDMLD
jgi:hypothetical protein